MKASPLVALISLSILPACEMAGVLTSTVPDVITTMGAPGPPKELRIESNKPGTAFCLDGAPLLSSDTRVSVHAGDRVYVVKPAPDKEVTIVAAKDGYFPFIDKVTREKVRMQFEFYERNSCTRSSAGRTCVTPALISDLNAFRQFCKKYP